MNKEEMIQGYRAYLKGRGLRAWSPFRTHVGYFLNWLAAKKLSLPELNPPLVHDYLCYRKSLGHRPVTAPLDALRSFLRYARHAEFLSVDPTQGVSGGWLDVPGGYPSYRGALREILVRPSPMVRHRFPLFAAEWESHLRSLLDQGFKKKTLHEVVFNNSWFSNYLEHKGITKIDKITPALLETFLRCKRREYHQEHGHPMRRKYIQKIRCYIKRFLTYALAQRHQSFEKPKQIPTSAAFPLDLLKRYQDFCRMDQGFRSTTLHHHRQWLEQFQIFLKRRPLRRIQDVTVIDIDAFVLHLRKRMGIRSLSHALAAIRGFFRYLYLHDEIPTNLADHVVSPCRFRSDRRPIYIPWKKIEHLLNHMDRTHPIGKRDYAILTLLAYHGLRAREAADLKLSDIDWDNSSLWIRGRKNNASVQLPLSPRVQEALRDYVAVRPVCRFENVFLRHAAPVSPLGAALKAVAQTHLRKHFGNHLSSYGSYVFRHSFAKALLDRGAKIHDVKSLLGHKLLRSTLVYTQINTEELREVADNYSALL